jgi:hypothetical protein
LTNHELVYSNILALIVKELGVTGGFHYSRPIGIGINDISIYYVIFPSAPITNDNNSDSAQVTNDNNNSDSAPITNNKKCDSDPTTNDDVHCQTVFNNFRISHSRK